MRFGAWTKRKNPRPFFLIDTAGRRFLLSCFVFPPISSCHKNFGGFWRENWAGVGLIDTERIWRPSGPVLMLGLEPDDPLARVLAGQ